MPPLSESLVPYKGTIYQISNILTEVKGFAVNQRHIVLVQICDEILLTQENYTDTISVVVNFISRNNRLQVSLGKDIFLLIFRDISKVSKLAKD